jgi:hypothetical protein
MIVIDLEGNATNWLLTGNTTHARMLNKSQLHLRTRNLLQEIYPTLQVLEEVPIHVRKKEILYLDFYIPLIKTCVEVHGEQHYKFIGHYHGNRFNFIKAKQRDASKKEWCQLNNIEHIELRFDQTNEEWKKAIEK